jgi:SAM-dependent methyltransferase
MNRERNLFGANSYERDLGFAPIDFLEKVLQRQEEAAWLDLCCGAGRALRQAAEAVQANVMEGKIKFTGVDLVPMFDPVPPGVDLVRLVSASVESWQTDERFDLITCVHGLHYVGDKLGVLQRAAGWMKPDGLLLMHIDYRNLRVAGRESSGPQLGRALRKAGFRYLSGRHLLVREGITDRCLLPYRYLGADDKAGPNFTGQAAVNSFYERTKA